MSRSSAATSRRRVATVLTAVALVLLLGASNGAESYEAPYRTGPSGGDEWNYIDASEDGRITIGRVYFVPAALNCPAEGGYANFRVRHDLRGRTRSVVVDYTEAAVDPYTIVTVVARAGGRAVGSKKLVGPVAGDGRIAVPLRVPRAARTLVIDFGLELTSACPSADGGTIRFATLCSSGTSKPCSAPLGPGWSTVHRCGPRSRTTERGKRPRPDAVGGSVHPFSSTTCECPGCKRKCCKRSH